MNYRPFVLPSAAVIILLVFSLPLALSALASPPEPTPTPQPRQPTESSALHPAGVWFTHTAENPVVNALLVDGDFIWTATNGDGVVRWNRLDGSFVKYTTAAGLVHNKVRTITKDEAGHFWFGTEGGVSELVLSEDEGFDGQTWTNYTTVHGLADNKVLAIAVGQAGHKWFATWGGVSEFDGHTWIKYTRASGLPSNHIHTIAADQTGFIWVGTPNGAAQFDGQRWTAFTSADGLTHNSVHAIAIDQAGQIWFGTPGGVSVYDGQRWITYTTANGLPSNHVQALTVDELGRVWVATALGLSVFDGDAWTRYDSPNNHILALAIDAAHHPWLGTADGVIGFDGQDWQAFHTGGLVSSEVRAMAEDRQGRKWFATNSGVSVYNSLIWTTYTTADSLADNRVNDLAVDTSGRLWFATQNGISTFDGRRWTTYTTADGLPGNEVKAIGKDEAGQLWFNIWFDGGSGASRLDGRTWTTITDASSLLITWDETSTAVDQAGREWSIWENEARSWERGVQAIDGSKTITYTGESLDYIFAIAVDKAGYKWFGGLGGVTLFDDNTWTTYTTAEILPRNRVDQIFVDSANHKWFNTMSAGVVEFDDTAAPVLAQTPPPATPILATLPLPTSTPTPVPSLTAAAANPFPNLLAEISLAPAGKTLQQTVLDQATGYLYVRDDGGHLYVIDATNLTELAAFQINGGESIMLDTPNHRLYIYSGYTSPVTVLDTTALTLTGVISPGTQLAVDSARNQIYTGGHLYDGATLQPLRAWPWRYGVFNPLRNEFLTLGLSALAIDRQTQRLTHNLLPDFTAQECYDCGGTASVSDIQLFPEQNLIAIASSVNSPGHGGRPQPDRFFDATTLDELTDLTGVPAIERGCGSQLLVGNPINGRLYRERVTTGFDHHYNLLVYGPDGELETWRDGIDLGVTNPNTGHMYLGDYGRLLVVDLTTLSPLGQIPGECVLNLDLANGRIYARRGGELLVFSEHGGRPGSPPADPAGLLPEGSIGAIKVSPGYVTDQTIFVQVGGQMIYRSTDGGLSWARLRGGLPEQAWLDVAISPNFKQDRTLFVGGDYQYGWGAGVYRSTDGGDTWQAVWRGLPHLRIKRVVVSSNYANDGTILAYADYARIGEWLEGGSVSRSNDRGLSWSLVITAPGSYPELPAPEELLPPDSLPPVRFRPIQYGVERTTDGGHTWQPLLISHRPEFSALAILLSPSFEADQTVYILSSEALYRSTDGGDTWEHGFDQFLAGRTYTNTMQAMAVSPPLEDSNHHLFLGSAAGEFWTLNPAEINWQPVPPASQWSTILAGEPINDLVVAPNGDIWLGTASNGLVRYADETIQTRYTITNGLPNQSVYSIAVASNGTLWIGSFGVIASFDGQTWLSHPLPQKELAYYTNNVAVGPDDTVWAGGYAWGIFRWDSSSWQKIAHPTGQSVLDTYEIEIDSKGMPWYTTDKGLVYYDGIRSHGIASVGHSIEFSPDGTLYSLARDGTVWAYVNSKWKLLVDAPKKSYVIWNTLYITRDSAIWLGTDEGAFRYDGQTWRQFTAQDGLPSNNVTAIAEDANGQLWFGTDNGAAYVDPTTLKLSPVVW